jgi:hypothetical protein
MREKDEEHSDPGSLGDASFTERMRKTLADESRRCVLRGRGWARDKVACGLRDPGRRGLLGRQLLEVLDQDLQPERVMLHRSEPEVFVEPGGRLVERIDHERTHRDHPADLEC